MTDKGKGIAFPTSGQTTRILDCPWDLDSYKNMKKLAWELKVTGEPMGDFMDAIRLRDNGGRRTGLDRRQFSYSGYLPERRSGKDRRLQLDRRKARFSNIPVFIEPKAET